MRTLLALALLTAAPLAGRGQDADPKAVVAKAVAAHGGAAALTAFGTSSTAATGSMTLKADEIPFTSDILFAAPDKLRLTLKATVSGRKIELVQVMNGDNFLQTTDGKPTTISDAEKGELKQALVMQDVATLVPLLTDKYTLKALPAEKVGDGMAAVVLATPAGAGAGKGADVRPVTLYFDGRTGYLVRHTRDSLAPGDKGNKMVKEDTRLSDFKKFDGVMMPTAMTVTHDGKPFMTMAVTAAKALPSIDAKEFAVPAKP